MKLSYRGHRYNAQSVDIQSVHTGLDGQFLGNVYPIYQPQVPTRRVNASLAYRGVSY